MIRFNIGQRLRIEPLHNGIFPKPLLYKSLMVFSTVIVLSNPTLARAEMPSNQSGTLEVLMEQFNRLCTTKALASLQTRGQAAQVERGRLCADLARQIQGGTAHPGRASGGETLARPDMTRAR